MKSTLEVLFLALSLFASPVYAGEWGSAGGGFSNNLMNPWFVKNLKGEFGYDVSFCIDVDAKGFSADPVHIRSLFKQALAYWQEQFEKERLLGIAKQNFVEKTGKCDGTEDLRLEFGYGTLTAEQLAEFKKQESEPEDFVAITVRTGFIARELRGKGFMYFGSDHGEHAYNHGNDVATNLWQHDGVLFRVMVHELGHLFGLPHVPGVPMGQEFPEFVLKNYANYREVGGLPPFFRGHDTYTFCGDSSAWEIPLPPNTHCVVIFFNANFSSMDLTTLDADNHPTGPVKNFRAMNVRAANIDFPVKVVFNREQIVFPANPGEKSWNGPARQSFTSYFGGSPEFGLQSLLVDVTPTQLRIHGVKDGKLLLLVDKNMASPGRRRYLGSAGVTKSSGATRTSSTR